MAGILGGAVTGRRLASAVVGLEGRAAETSWQFEHGEAGLAVTYPTADPMGVTWWEDGDRAGVVYGAVTNLAELGMESPELFQRLLDDPVRTAAAIEGSFLAVCYDGAEDRHVLVTDKLGGRSCYYTTGQPSAFAYSTSVSALLPFVREPTLDLQGVSDMLLMGHLWGDGTLVEEVRAVRPATVLEVTEDRLDERRYWTPDYTPHARGDAYFDELEARYTTAAARCARTLPSGSGIWLSGGLDSRTTAAALLATPDWEGREGFTAYGYDANPPTNDNPRLARRTARKLGIEYDEVPLSAETLAEDFERVIEVTDGMLRWNTAANLSPSYRVTDDTPVLLEGAEGALLGDHLLRYHFDDSRSVVEAQLKSEAAASPETVRGLLRADVDPLNSFEREAARCAERSHRESILDIHFQNYHARLGLASNRVMRDRGGSREVQTDGAYLDWCARLPRYYRKGTFPLSDRFVEADAGGVPYGTSIAKLKLCRRVAPELADIPYERTKVTPRMPYHLHVAGFVGNVLTGRLRGKATYGAGSLADFWIRDTDTEIHSRVAELVESAAARDIFDGDAVRRVFQDHMNGTNEASLLGAITTVEYWIGTYLD